MRKRSRTVSTRRCVSLGILLVVGAGFAAAADVAREPSAGPGFPTPEVLKTLGPGPVAFERTVAVGRTTGGKTDSIGDAIDRCVEDNMALFGAPGAAVRVLLDGDELYASGYGVRTRSSDRVVTPETRFRIGSVTKMMTAAAVMQQVELGRVDLHAPVTDYVPEFEVAGPWPSELITVWHALTHSTGFPDHLNTLWATGDNALSEWAANQDQIELHAPPGSFWNYSNPNFALAGLVAERAAGVPYRQLYKEQLWEPAGMDDTTFDPDEVIDSGNYAVGYHWDEESQLWYGFNPRENDLWAAGPAGFAFSNVIDLSNWALLLMDGGGPVLSPFSAATMQDRHQWTHYLPDMYYGFGISIESYRGLDVRQHGGNVAGFGTYLLWVPDRRFVVALTVNVTQTLTEAAYCIVDEVLAPDPVDSPELSTDPATWGRYTGDYLFTQSDGLSSPGEVYLDGDRLMADIEDPDEPGTIYTTELFQLYLDTFLFDSDGDGTVETDLTFCERAGSPGFTMWARNRYAVGEKELRPRTGSHRRSP
jgi:CubicO group peptidase (beta-lactamase class C family)